MKVVFKVSIFSMLVFVISFTFTFTSCTFALKRPSADFEAYHLEGKLVTNNHFGNFANGFEYDACGIIAVNGKKPVIMQYEWDWDNDGEPDTITFPPECKVIHKYDDKDVGIVTPSVKVVVSDVKTTKHYSAQTAKEKEDADNLFYTWNYGTWELENAYINDTDCYDVKAGEKCKVSFSARYKDKNGSLQQLKFAPICIVPEGMNNGVSVTETINMTLSATVSEFQNKLNLNVPAHIKNSIIEDLAKNGMVFDGSNSDNNFLNFNDNTNCKGILFTTNSDGLIGFDFKAKEKFLETAKQRECLNNIETLNDCELKNTQSIKYQSLSSINNFEINKEYSIKSADPVSWKVYQFDKEGRNYDADSISQNLNKNYDLIMLDRYDNPVNGNNYLMAVIDDPKLEAFVSSHFQEKTSYALGAISLYGFDINYSSAVARVLQLSLSGNNVKISTNVSITHGTGFELECQSECPSITGIVKTQGSGIVSLKVLDEHGNIVSGQHNRPVVTWSISDENNAPVFINNTRELSVVTDERGYNTLNLNNIRFGKRRGDYELVAKLGFMQKKFSIKVQPGMPAGVSFSAYTDNENVPVNGLDSLKKTNELNGVPFVFKKINYENLGSTYGRTVKIYVVDDENNLIEKNDLSLDVQKVTVMPHSMIDKNGNINSFCEIENGCQVLLESERLYSDRNNEHSFSLNEILNYDTNVNFVKFLATMSVDGHNYLVVSEPVEAKMGYGYEIKDPMFTYDNSIWLDFSLEDNKYVLNFDRDAWVKFSICPADLTLDPRDASLNINTVVELLDEETNIFDEESLKDIGSDFDKIGITNCIDAVMKYTYPEKLSALNEELIFRVKDYEETISVNFPFVVHSLSKAGLSVSTDSINFGLISYYDDVQSDIVTISKTGEQLLNGGIDVSLTDRNNCFILSEENGVGTDSVSFKIIAKGTDDSCVGVHDANLAITATTVSGTVLNSNISLTFKRQSKAEIVSNPQLYDFGKVFAHSTSGVKKSFTISNNGSTPLTINVEADTLNPDMFVVDGSACNNVSISSSNSSCNVDVSIDKTSINYGLKTGKFLIKNAVTGTTILSVNFDVAYYYDSAKFAFEGATYNILMNQRKQTTFTVVRDPKTAPADPNNSIFDLAQKSLFSIDESDSETGEFTLTYKGSHGQFLDPGITIKSANCWMGDSAKTCIASIDVKQPAFAIEDSPKWDGDFTIRYGGTKKRKLTFVEKVIGWEQIASLEIKGPAGTVTSGKKGVIYNDNGMVVAASVKNNVVEFEVDHDCDCSGKNFNFTITAKGNHPAVTKGESSFNGSINITTDTSGYKNNGISLATSECDLGYIRYGDWQANKTTRTCKIIVKRVAGSPGGTIDFSNNAPSGFVFSSVSDHKKITYGTTSSDYTVIYEVSRKSNKSDSLNPELENKNQLSVHLGSSNIGNINVSGFVEYFKSPIITFNVPKNTPLFEYKQGGNDAKIATVVVNNSANNVRVDATYSLSNTVSFELDSKNNFFKPGGSGSILLRAKSNSNIEGNHGGTLTITTTTYPAKSKVVKTEKSPYYEYKRLSRAKLGINNVDNGLYMKNVTWVRNSATVPADWEKNLDVTVFWGNTGGSTANNIKIRDESPKNDLLHNIYEWKKTPNFVDGDQKKTSDLLNIKAAGCHSVKYVLTYNLSRYTTDEENIDVNLSICRKPPKIKDVKLTRIDLDDITKNIYITGFNIDIEDGRSLIERDFRGTCTINLMDASNSVHFSRELGAVNLDFLGKDNIQGVLKYSLLKINKGDKIRKANIVCKLNSTYGECTNCISSNLTDNKGVTLRTLNKDTISGKTLDYYQKGTIEIIIHNYSNSPFNTSQTTSSITSDTKGFKNPNCRFEENTFICTYDTLENGHGVRSGKINQTISILNNSTYYFKFDVSYTRRAPGILSWKKDEYIGANGKEPIEYRGSKIDPSFAIEQTGKRKYWGFDENIPNVWLRLFPIGYITDENSNISNPTKDFSCLSDVKLEHFTEDARYSGLLTLTPSEDHASKTTLCPSDYINFTLADVTNSNIKRAGCYKGSALFSAKRSAYTDARSYLLATVDICRKAKITGIKVTKMTNNNNKIKVSYTKGATSIIVIVKEPKGTERKYSPKVNDEEKSYTTDSIEMKDSGDYKISAQVTEAIACTDNCASEVYTEYYKKQ